MKRLLLCAALGTVGLAQTTLAQTVRPAPIPLVTPPGQVQPVAPGTRPAPVLAALRLSPAVPGVQKVEVLGNGFVKAAHALILLPAREATTPRALSLATQSVLGAFRADPALI